METHAITSISTHSQVMQYKCLFVFAGALPLLSTAAEALNWIGVEKAIAGMEVSWQNTESLSHIYGVDVCLNDWVYPH
jgi:hypothetical protein